VARRSLKPQLNQIRAWVRQGRTDAWIAHQLDVSVKDLNAFKREHDLAPADADDGGPGIDDELDLRAEDDALVAAALEADDEEAEEDEEDGDESDQEERRPRRRRGRRGGRGRRGAGAGRAAAAKPLEGTFDHGDEGYGLWLDPAIQDDPIYAEHWQGHRPVTVTVERDRIVIRRAGEEEPGDEGGNDDSPELDPDEFDA
jgi:hypothetical protein